VTEITVRSQFWSYHWGSGGWGLSSWGWVGPLLDTRGAYQWGKTPLFVLIGLSVTGGIFRPPPPLRPKWVSWGGRSLVSLRGMGEEEQRSVGEGWAGVGRGAVPPASSRRACRSKWCTGAPAGDLLAHGRRAGEGEGASGTFGGAWRRTRGGAPPPTTPSSSSPPSCAGRGAGVPLDPLNGH